MHRPAKPQVAEKTNKDYSFWLQLNEKPSVIPGWQQVARICKQLVLTRCRGSNAYKATLNAQKMLMIAIEVLS